MFFDTWYGLLRVLVVSPLAYVGLILLLRASGKRTLSKMNAFDFIVTVAMGSMLATAILSKSVFLMESLLGMGMLILLQYAITWLSVRSDRVSKIIKAEPSLLFHKGKYLDDQLRRMRVTRSEVEAAVRNAGNASIADIEGVILETDGTFSVLQMPNTHQQWPIGIPKP